MEYIVSTSNRSKIQARTGRIYTAPKLVLTSADIDTSKGKYQDFIKEACFKINEDCVEDN